MGIDVSYGKWHLVYPTATLTVGLFVLLYTLPDGDASDATPDDATGYETVEVPRYAILRGYRTLYADRRAARLGCRHRLSVGAGRDMS